MLLSHAEAEAEAAFKCCRFLKIMVGTTSQQLVAVVAVVVVAKRILQCVVVAGT